MFTIETRRIKLFINIFTYKTYFSNTLGIKALLNVNNISYVITMYVYYFSNIYFLLVKSHCKYFFKEG